MSRNLWRGRRERSCFLLFWQVYIAIRCRMESIVVRLMYFQTSSFYCLLKSSTTFTNFTPSKKLSRPGSPHATVKTAPPLPCSRSTSMTTRSQHMRNSPIMPWIEQTTNLCMLDIWSSSTHGTKQIRTRIKSRNQWLCIVTINRKERRNWRASWAKRENWHYKSTTAITAIVSKKSGVNQSPCAGSAEMPKPSKISKKGWKTKKTIFKTCTNCT